MTDLVEAQAVRRPLDGITVIETSSFLTGPFTAMMLSDLGADVIKVEPPTGDGFRNFGHKKDGYGATWTNANRGKRSIVIDLKTPEGLDRLKALLKTADVLVENWRPKVAAKLGLGNEVVAALNPRLIRLSITGFGDSGPLADEAAFDATIQGRVGLITAEARNVGQPAITPFNMVDKVTGTFGAQAILAALFERERTGKGAQLKMPMLDVLGYFNFPDMYQHRVFDGDTSAWKPPLAPVIQTRDGHIVISPSNGPQMSRTLEAIDRTEWKAEVRAIKDPAAMALEFFRRVATVVEGNTSAYWLERFAAFDVPAGPVGDLDDYLNEPQVAHNRIFETIDSNIGPIRTARYPALFDGRRFTARRGPPAIGEHDKEVTTAA